MWFQKKVIFCKYIVSSSIPIQQDSWVLFLDLNVKYCNLPFVRTNTMDLLGLYLNKTCATYFPPCITENGITCFQECNYNVIIKFCFGINHKLLQWCTSRHARSILYCMLPVVTITISMLHIKELTQQDVWKTQDLTILRDNCCTTKIMKARLNP